MRCSRTGRVALEPLERRALYSVTAGPFGTLNAGEVDVATNGRHIVLAKSVWNQANFYDGYLEFYDARDQFPLRGTRKLPDKRFEFEVDADDPQRPVHIHGAAIAMASDGSFVVAWVRDRYADGQYLNSQVRVRRYDAEGNPLTRRITVINTESLERLGSNNPEYSLDPSVATNNRGEFVVSYTHRVSGNRLDVSAKVYEPDGSLRHRIRVAKNSRDEGESDVAMNLDGHGFDIVYTTTDSENDTDIVLARYRGDGSLRPFGKRKVAMTLDREGAPSISISPDGSNGIVAWLQETPGAPLPQFSQALGRRYRGSRFADPFEITSVSPLLPSVFLQSIANPREPLDIAIFDNGVSIVNFESVIMEDPEDLLENGEAEGVLMGEFGSSRESPSVAIGQNGVYFAAVTTPVGGPADEANALIGTVPGL